METEPTARARGRGRRDRWTVTLIFEPASSDDLKFRDHELKRLIIKAAINRATRITQVKDETGHPAKTRPAGRLATKD